MKKVRFIRLIMFSVLALGLAASPALAQTGNPVTAEVDRTILTTDDTLLLSVTIDTSAGDASRPQLPTLDGFTILGSSSGTQMSIINGAMSVKATYQYRLQPTAAGDLIIDPITVNVGGTDFTSQPISVNVSQGTGVPSQSPPPASTIPGFPSFGSLGNFGSMNLPSLLGQLSQFSAPAGPSGGNVEPFDPANVPVDLVGQDFYAQALVDHATPYQGEQVNYTLRFYQAVSVMRQIEYQQPTFTGFWSEKEPQRQEFSLQTAGRNYFVTELSTSLFPTVVGEVTIDPSVLSIPGDFFSRGQSVSTKPINVIVKPLPDPAPSSFQGAVGRFTIQSAVDKSETVVNDTVTMQVQISGQGNLATMGEPHWPDLPDWRAFDSQGTVETRYEDGQMVGSHTYDRILVPTTAGDLILPAVEYSYFDPELNDYVTIATQPLPVHVAPDISGGNITSGADPGSSTLPASASGLSSIAPTLNPEFRPMKPAPIRWNLGSQSLTGQIGYWLLWIVPLLLLVGHSGWRFWRQHRHANIDNRRSQYAARKAGRALSQAKADARKNQAAAYKAAGQIMLTYISERLNISTAGLTYDALGELLAEHGADQHLVEQAQNCLMISEMGWYAPFKNREDGSSDSGNILAETKQLISELDKIL